MAVVPSAKYPTAIVVMGFLSNIRPVHLKPEPIFLTIADRRAAAETISLATLP